MFKWQQINDETARRIWDSNLMQLSDCSPFQTYAWGEYNRALGWQPLYFAAFDEKEEIAAMCLGLLRRYPLGIGLLWCVGGLVGDIRAWDENLRKAVLESTGLKHLYFRFRCDRERDIKDVLSLNNQKWTRTGFMMTSGLSMELDLTRTPDELLAGLSGKWRRNLRLAQKNNLVIKTSINPDIEELSRVFAEMESRKNLPQLFSHEKLENLFKYVGGNLVFFRCEDDEGRLLCFRASLIIGNRACDYFAAVTDPGLKLRASYAAFWEMLLHCKESGITRYDLGGIDPQANPGVYTFKKETGAREVEFLGEWDWATASWLRLIGNLAIQRRQNAKPPKTEQKPGFSAKPFEKLTGIFGRLKKNSIKTAQSPVK